MNDYLLKSYFDWLVEKIDLEEKVSLYESLLEFLFDKDFIWLENIPLDKNRASDGLNLRKEYMQLLSPEEQMIFEHLFNNKNCSMLEMLISFSIRLMQLVNMKACEFFWLFIDNLGLNWATDYDFDMDIVNGTIDDFLYGTINGKEPNDTQHPPVLFPCRRVYADMNLDLYMQANLYFK